jgi:DNA invertase Pin-like site-specific DNA recombinase
MTTAPKFVAYYRVSTERQGRSGLGLEAQTVTVETHAKRSGGEIIASFQEIESGKRSDRPELAKALALCKKHKATLIIAKLDRLSRNVAFIANLIESKVDFIACDMPQANTLGLHIMAAMAQHEREATSQRTKEALAAVKARGKKLGNPRPNMPTVYGQRAEQARARREVVYPLAKQMRDSGLTLREIADQLNARGVKSLHAGNAWHAESVRQVLKQHSEANNSGVAA